MAQTYRLFLPATFPESDFFNEEATTWAIEDKPTLHHVVTVQRLKVGQAIIAVHPRLERARLCKVEVLSKQALTLKPLQLVPATENRSPKITLAMALIKEARWDWVLQKATELGVRTIQPLITEFTVVSPNNIAHKLERWQAICQTAALQSEGLFIPTVLPPIELKAFLAQPKVANTLQLVALERELETVLPLKTALGSAMEVEEKGLVGWDNEARGTELGRLHRVNNRHEYRSNKISTPNRPFSSASTAYTVAVGAEGGWSEAEKALWQSLSADWQGVSLGTRILRAETAALLMIGAIMYEQA
ncbi:MAG: 16S rRNA (uracil(1498)-N(3))-methyltransferase [Candidatus Melainabacteria bacterium]|nr:16S rRNA (uracil(1498)-N(3))-methyltransferase [Candidatus Melainabacteria bacterium]